MMTEETLTALRNRYGEPEIPKCSICGGELSIQRSGGGSPTIWACSGMIDDPTGERSWVYAEGRSMADDHYDRSRWTDYRRGGDIEVIELIDAYLSITQPGGVTNTVEPASPALKLPDGWVAVPLEPTPGMMVAGTLVSEFQEDPSGMYRAMVAAAPSVPHTAPIEPICATGGAEWVKLTPEQAKKIYRDLDACQKVIHYARGFDPSYVTDAQDCLKIIDNALAAAPEES